MKLYNYLSVLTNDMNIIIKSKADSILVKGNLGQLVKTYTKIFDACLSKEIFDVNVIDNMLVITIDYKSDLNKLNLSLETLLLDSNRFNYKNIKNELIKLFYEELYEIKLLRTKSGCYYIINELGKRVYITYAEMKYKYDYYYTRYHSEKSYIDFKNDPDYNWMVPYLEVNFYA